MIMLLISSKYNIIKILVPCVHKAVEIDRDRFFYLECFNQKKKKNFPNFKIISIFYYHSERSSYLVISDNLKVVEIEGFWLDMQF